MLKTFDYIVVNPPFSDKPWMDGIVIPDKYGRYTETDIRKKMIDHRYIKGIIGLPANLFYGTGIPACIIVIDKEDAINRKESLN